MDQTQRQIDLFHTLFYLCLGICIFCLILSIIFFFKFNIINIFNARTRRLRRPVGRGNTGTLSRSCNMGNSKKLGSPTAALSPGAGTTEVLNQMEQQEVNENYGMFRIEKYVLYIHTDEVT